MIVRRVSRCERPEFAPSSRGKFHREKRAPDQAEATNQSLGGAPQAAGSPSYDVRRQRRYGACSGSVRFGLECLDSLFSLLGR